MMLYKDGEISIQKGETWVFLGLSGSGKTALGRRISARVKGAVYIGFESQQELIEEERERDESDFINEIDPGRSVMEYLKETSSASTEEIQKTVDLFGLDAFVHRGLRFLSTGELRKTILSKAYLSGPEVLILDDPFVSLDTDSRRNLLRVVRGLYSEGIQLIFMLNRLEEVPTFASHAAFINDGIPVLKGEKTIIDSPGFIQLFRMHREIPRTLPGFDDGIFSTNRSRVLVDMRNIHISYHGSGKDVTRIFENFNFRIHEGEHWKITGPNGVGKSTLLQLLSGDHPQCYSNDISIFGKKRGSGESVWEIKQEIGIVSSSLQFDYRVNSSILTTVLSGFYDSIGMYTRHSPRQEQLAREWIDLMGMKGEEKNSFQSLSFGKKRMVLIARAMVKHPRILILDEPCQGIDPVHRELILKLIDIIAERGRTTVLYVTHHEEDRIPSIKKHLRLSRRRCLGYPEN